MTIKERIYEAKKTDIFAAFGTGEGLEIKEIITILQELSDRIAVLEEKKITPGDIKFI